MTDAGSSSDPAAQAPLTPSWSWGTLTALLLVSSLPYLAGLAWTPAGSSYDWIIPPYPEDGLAYLAWVRQSAAGALLFKIKYTALPHSAAVLNPFFLAAGWLSWITGWGAGFALFVTRLAGVVLFFRALVAFIARLGLDAATARLALLMVLFSAGLGGFLPPALRDAFPDLGLVDTNTLWEITWNPLFPLVLALLLTVLRWVDDDAFVSSRLRPVGVGMAIGMFGLLHPYDVVLSAALAAVVALLRFRQRAVIPLVLAGLAAVPLVAYPAYVSMSHPILAAHGLHGMMETPPLERLLAGFGPVALLALVGVATRSERRATRMLVAWVLASLALSLLPIWFQRKMLFGIHLPLAMLAGIGLSALHERVRRTSAAAAAIVTAVCLAIACFSQTTILQQTLAELRDPQEQAAYYVPDDLKDAFAFLSKTGGPDDVVFADYATSRLIPGETNHTVVHGHWAQSVDLEARNAWLQRVFAADPDVSVSARLAELRQARVRYLLFNPSTRQMFQPGPPQWLLDSSTPVFHSGSVDVLELKGSDG